MPTFERVLWRACRGNVFLRQAEIEDPLEDPSTVRSLSIVFTTTSPLPLCCDGWLVPLSPPPPLPLPSSLPFSLPLTLLPPPYPPPLPSSLPFSLLTSPLIPPSSPFPSSPPPSPLPPLTRVRGYTRWSSSSSFKEISFEAASERSVRGTCSYKQTATHTTTASSCSQK